MIQAIVFTITLTSVYSLERLQKNPNVFSKIMQLLSSKPMRHRRTLDLDSLKEAKIIYKQIIKNMNRQQIKQLLREGPEVAVDSFIPAHPDDQLAEKELKESLFDKNSALFDRPHIESAGKKDYLVLDHQQYDHFVTVIPNSMYQRIEKKCVNWLDDCSVKGIRARLLRGVQSPYR